MIITTAVQDLVSKLNPVWFTKKKETFEQEGFYNKAQSKISVEILEYESIQVAEDEWKELERKVKIDIDLPAYCWNSFFYGSESYNFDSENAAPELPVDGNEIACKIVELINKHIEKFTDVTAINAVIENVVASFKNTVDQLKESSNDTEYAAFLDDFLNRATQEINSEFEYINQQIELKKTPGSIARKLSPEICSKIANFKVAGKRLITTVNGVSVEGTALFQLLTPGTGYASSIKIRIEDWKNNDVYYLLHRLSVIITDKYSIADIERKKILYLKTGKLFMRSLYDSFKSQKFESYFDTNPNKSIIDSQIDSLF